jgi:ribosome-associated heat shock protein Hsp15
MEVTRVDRWLWAVRLCKTRSAATDACKAGHVRLNGATAKPSSAVRVGDRVSARLHDRDRILEVTRVIDGRVAPSVAIECFIDHSPPPIPAELSAPAGIRDAASGRPTKRERRLMDRFRGR